MNTKTGTGVDYEWDAELFIRTQPDRPAHEDTGDILDHYHTATLADAAEHKAMWDGRADELDTDGQPTAIRLVVVRDTFKLGIMDDRMWAYLRPDNTLPEYFEEPSADGSYRSTGVKVPGWLHREVAAWARKAGAR